MKTTTKSEHLNWSWLSFRFNQQKFDKLEKKNYFDLITLNHAIAFTPANWLNMNIQCILGFIKQYKTNTLLASNHILSSQSFSINVDKSVEIFRPNQQPSINSVIQELTFTYIWVCIHKSIKIWLKAFLSLAKKKLVVKFERRLHITLSRDRKKTKTLLF